MSITPPSNTSIPTTDTTSPLFAFIIEGSAIALYIFLARKFSAPLPSVPLYNAFSIGLVIIPSLLCTVLVVSGEVINVNRDALSSNVRVFFTSPFALAFASETTASIRAPRVFMFLFFIKFVSLELSPAFESKDLINSFKAAV